MCAQCVAQGAAYVVPGLAALRLWSWRRTRSLEQESDEPVADVVAQATAHLPE